MGSNLSVPIAEEEEEEAEPMYEYSGGPDRKQKGALGMVTHSKPLDDRSSMRVIEMAASNRDSAGDRNSPDGSPTRRAVSIFAAANGLPPKPSMEIISSQQVIAALSIYWAVSFGIVFLNRILFTGLLGYPVFITWFQQIFGLLLILTVNFLRRRLEFTPLLNPDMYSFKTLKAVWPLNVSFVGMVGFANLCLKNVQISTYQVARALTLTFNLLLSSVWLGSNFSMSSWLACGLVTLGFIIGATDPLTLSFNGCVLGSISSLFQATYTVSIKQVLPLVGNNEVTLLFYNLVTASVAFFPLIFIAAEGGAFADVFYNPTRSFSKQLFLVLLLVMSGFFGLFINFITYYCVRITSPVSFTVCGYAKACSQTLGGIVLLSDVVTVKAMAGVVLTLGGSFWYSHSQYRQNCKITELTKPKT